MPGPMLNPRLIRKLARVGLDTLQAKALLGKIGARETSAVAVIDARATGQTALDDVLLEMEEPMLKKILDAKKSLQEFQAGVAELTAQLDRAQVEAEAELLPLQTIAPLDARLEEFTRYGGLRGEVAKTRGLPVHYAFNAAKSCTLGTAGASLSPPETFYVGHSQDGFQIRRTLVQSNS